MIYYKKEWLFKMENKNTILVTHIFDFNTYKAIGFTYLNKKYYISFHNKNEKLSYSVISNNNNCYTFFKDNYNFHKMLNMFKLDILKEGMEI